jgi:hypothetical protein
MRFFVAMGFLVATITAASGQYYGSQRSGYGSSGSYGGGYGYGSNPSGHYVAPHVNSRGSYVDGHYRSNPNSTQYDNYGTRGNVNPYTGSYGTRSPRY